MPLVQKSARPEFSSNIVLQQPQRCRTVQVKALIIPKKLFIVSGRFLIPGTRVVCAIPEMRILAIDVNDVTAQIKPTIEELVATEHARDLPRERGVKLRCVLSRDFLKMNLQIVEYASVAAARASAALKAVVEVPSVTVQTEAMDAVETLTAGVLAVPTAAVPS